MFLYTENTTNPNIKLKMTIYCTQYTNNAETLSKTPKQKTNKSELSTFDFIIYQISIIHILYFWYVLYILYILYILYSSSMKGDMVARDDSTTSWNWALSQDGWRTVPCASSAGWLGELAAQKHSFNGFVQPFGSTISSSHLI